MALFRALESARPPSARLFDDPLASEFLGPAYRFVASMGAPARWYIDWRWPGARTSGVARTRLIDDYLTAALKTNIAQVVILGAGFDTRAYRIPGIERVRVFEVDHPNTLAARRAHLPEAAPHIARTATDFNTGSLTEALHAPGFEAEHRTFFIWEGVTNYLTGAAVGATFDFIGATAAGSRVAFTYVHHDVLRDPSRFPGGERLMRMLERIGEKWTFGLDPAEVPGFLAQHGLKLVEDAGSVEYRAKYLPGPARGYEFYRAALAEVSAAAAP